MSALGKIIMQIPACCSDCNCNMSNKYCAISRKDFEEQKGFHIYDGRMESCPIQILGPLEALENTIPGAYDKVVELY